MRAKDVVVAVRSLASLGIRLVARDDEGGASGGGAGASADGALRGLFGGLALDPEVGTAFIVIFINDLAHQDLASEPLRCNGHGDRLRTRARGATNES